ncbi:branched-chain amino acid ABC transporter substrate-binding protein [Vibrio ponticus]|uniref:Branched-chain amino acid ABC transporter substrate-binding protein n=1 Tax=Vibrio ponticus TaxID=265668 RepID=A0A3N3DZS3_9VIBR|nr:ABC transporter substrate-binding protein [Vibrio ponticus]ROV59961.1 branched-chain amino acid ABC transporter substrate-binding protein [Vibrio ponticus]
MLKIKYRLKLLFFYWIQLLIFSSAVNAQEVLQVNIHYLKQTIKRPPALSNVIEIPKDSGLQGAVLGVADSNSTGKFLKQSFQLKHAEFDSTEGILSKLDQAYATGEHLFVLNVSTPTLVAANQWAQQKGVLLFNVNDSADELRSTQCLTSVLHTAPSNAMRSDAIAQWLLSKRFNQVLMVNGSKPEDKALSESFRRSAKRYGLNVIEEKTWSFNSDLRRSAQQEIPLFTQTRKEYDVVYVADQSKDFAEYLPFNTYIPRPVVGSAGLEALSWHAVIEQWGAAQVQKRFRDQANRSMNELDFSAYLAVRSVAQAVHKQKSSQNQDIVNFIKSDDFELAAYKGRKLSYRSWSGQLRIPMALVQPNGLVSLSPQAGVLHPRTELDTLGFDIEETQCVSQKELL